MGLVEVLREVAERVFRYLWKSPTPWPFIGNCFGTAFLPKKNLATHKIIDPLVATDCVWCEGEVETSLHLFLHCDFAYRVWTKILGWLGVQFITPQNLFYHLECWFKAARDKRLRNGFWLIWHTTIWVL